MLASPPPTPQGGALLEVGAFKELTEVKCSPNDAAASPAGPWSGAELTMFTNDRVARLPRTHSGQEGPRGPHTHKRRESSPPPPGTMTVEAET